MLNDDENQCDLTQCDIVPEALVIVLRCESKRAVMISVSRNRKTFETLSSGAILESRVGFQQILHSLELNFQVSFWNWNIIQTHKSLENKSWAFSDVLYKNLFYHYHHKSHAFDTLVDLTVPLPGKFAFS